MNILIINYEYPPIGAGAANASFHISNALAGQGHSVSVITSAFGRYKGYSSCNGVNIHRIKAWRKLSHGSNVKEMASFVFSAILNSHRIVRQEATQGAIVFFTLPCGPIGLMLKSLYGIPYIISLRGGDVPGAEPKLHYMHGALKTVRRCVLGSAKSIVANSPGLAELSQKTDPFPVKVITNGVDTEFFKPADSHENRPFRFLFAGRLQEQKNLFFMLENLAALSGETKIQFIVDIAGDGPLKEKLQSYARNLALNAKITWHGWKDKNGLLELYRQSNCLLNPSVYEGMPNTVLEAMACGLPVIASDIMGNRDLVRHNETGFIFSLNKPEEFRRYMLTIAENTGMCNEFGQNARNRAIREFSWDKTAFEYAGLLFERY